MASVSEVKREVLGKRGIPGSRTIYMPRKLSSAMTKDADVTSSVTTPGKPSVRAITAGCR